MGTRGYAYLVHKYKNERYWDCRFSVYMGNDAYPEYAGRKLCEALDWWSGPSDDEDDADYIYNVKQKAAESIVREFIPHIASGSWVIRPHEIETVMGMFLPTSFDKICEELCGMWSYFITPFPKSKGGFRMRVYHDKELLWDDSVYVLKDVLKEVDSREI